MRCRYAIRQDSSLPVFGGEHLVDYLAIGQKCVRICRTAYWINKFPRFQGTHNDVICKAFLVFGGHIMIDYWQASLVFWVWEHMRIGYYSQAVLILEKHTMLGYWHM